MSSCIDLQTSYFILPALSCQTHVPYWLPCNSVARTQRRCGLEDSWEHTHSADPGRGESVDLAAGDLTCSDVG